MCSRAPGRLRSPYAPHRRSARRKRLRHPLPDPSESQPSSGPTGATVSSDRPLVPGVVHANRFFTDASEHPHMSFIVLACVLVAIDGDTLRCGEETIRLLGIDAPELPGHCREGRDCAPGDPFAARTALKIAARGEATVERIGKDVYSRTLARVRVNGIDLSCSQMAGGHAVYKPDWDQFQLVATGCNTASGVKPKRHSSPNGHSRTTDRRSASASTGWSYRNCAEARRAGAAPLRRGAPGYGPHMDGDGDGIACEPVRR